MRPFRALLGAVLILAALWLFAVDVTSVNPPEQAIVLLDPLRNVYFSPPLVDGDQRRFVVAAELASAVRNGARPASDADEQLSEGWGDPQSARVWLDLGRNTYSWEPPEGAILVNPVPFSAALEHSAQPDPEHERAGGFSYVRSQFRAYLEDFGLRRSRWSSTGSWNW